MLHGIGIIRMHLDAELVLRVDDLDKERELRILNVAKELSVRSIKLGKRHALILSLCDAAVTVRMGADAPALTDSVSFLAIMKFRNEPLASPNILLQHRLQDDHVLHFYLPNNSKFLRTRSHLCATHSTLRRGSLGVLNT